MRRAESTLYAPYRQIGVVCSAVPPILRVEDHNVRNYSLFCAIDNFVVNYRADKLRTRTISDALPNSISAMAANKTQIYVACGTEILLLHYTRKVIRRIPVGAATRHLLILGELLVAVDVNNTINVIDTASGECSLRMEWPASAFEITVLMHPATYLNKILLGSSDGRLRLVNIVTGKLIYEFKPTAKTPSKVTVIAQSPALDVVAVGHESGIVEMRHLKEDETLFSFKHEAAVTAVAFRSDEQPFLTTADANGVIAIWHLEKRTLVGKVSNVHTKAVHYLEFIPGEAIMISGSIDNSLRVWVLDQPDDMPRQLVILEGHSKALSAVVFASRDEVITASLDESVRKHSVIMDAMRHKLGSAGIMSRAKAKAKKRSIDSIRIGCVVEMAFGWAREAAWDNVLCRHEGELIVTTWTTRKNAQGTHNLLHERFTKDSTLAHHKATSIAISPCGNFGYVGYSTGDIDQFNIQSGRHVKTFCRGKKPAHDSEVTALACDVTGKEVVTGGADGTLRFWSVGSSDEKTRLLATMKAPKDGRVMKSASSNVNSLLAVVLQRDADDGNGVTSTVSLIDTLCRRVVRNIPQVSGVIPCVCFSADGRTLLVADSHGHIRVWDIAAAQLVDVLLSSFPCVAMAFNTTGEYLVTCHKDQRGLYVWASKNHFVAPIAPKALPVDFVPEWPNEEAEGRAETQASANMMDSDDEDEEMSEEEEPGHQEDSEPVVGDTSLLRLSGLPPARWANLPNLSLIRERNKPIAPPTKPARAPFFMTAAPTLDGFEFEKEKDDWEERRRILKAKRNLLELESAFSKQLKEAESDEDFVQVFSLLKQMSVSAIDFQIRTLAPEAIVPMLRMLLAMTRRHEDFDLVQAYLATFVKIHRTSLWSSSVDETNEPDEMSEVLAELAAAQKESWQGLDSLFTENLAIIDFAKTTLL